MALTHGGGLNRAAATYGIESEKWLDLSTGISPWSYPLPPVPEIIWQRLPQADDELSRVAADYYGCCTLLPVAGSQEAIMALPHLVARQSGRVALPRVGYKEHEAAWRAAGWQVSHYESEPDATLLDEVDLLLVINPNNPAGYRYSSEQLLAWHQRLSCRGATLMVDEAFIDATTQNSLLTLFSQGLPQGLILLRSMGKFFGLAGIRLGFAFADESFLAQLAQQLGPWSVSGPARWAGAQALNDRSWQQMQKERLSEAAQRLTQLLSRVLGLPSRGCGLFQSCYGLDAPALHHHLAKLAILTRLTDEHDAVRFGLPACEVEWQRLGEALRSWS